MSPRASQLAAALRQRALALRERARRPRADDEPRLSAGARVRRGWRRFRRATDRYRLLTDVVGAVVIVALLVGGLAAATGGVWPPIVIVESGSMMQTLPETPYGRIGTIDVGDIVFVKAYKDPLDVETWADGTSERYGRPGDVIAFWPNGHRDPEANRSVLHRAIAYVEVGQTAPGQVVYRLEWIDGQVLTWDSRGIYFPALGFHEAYGFSPVEGYKPTSSGYITKGDNTFSNPASDQALGISRVVDPTWIVGRVYGEVPWMGLGKLALQSGETNPEVPGWDRVGNAFAPLELWSMFFLTLAVLILVPLSFDTWRAWRRIRREREAERLLEEENRRRIEARRQQGAPRRVTTFAAVVSSRPASRPAQEGGGAGPQGR